MLGPENVRLLEEMIEQNYGNVPRSPAEIRDIAKTDAPILSTTTGYFNATFGASVFQQLNESAVLFGLLPKFAYKRSGFRAQTTRFKNSGIGVAENAAVPDSVKPTMAQITVGIKEQAITMEYSERQRLLAGTMDDVGFDVAQLLERAKQSFAYALDADMNVAMETLASNNIESIDRVCSSYAEITNCGETAGDADIYGLDRDAAATYADAYVSHNSNTARALSDKIVRSLVSNTTLAGADPKTQFWYTGEDTYSNLCAMYGTQMRYVQPSDNPFRASTNPTQDGKGGGSNFGMEMATLYGRPIYVAPSDKVVKSGTSVISNLYLLDIGYDAIYREPKLGVKVLQAPIIAETTLANYPAHAKLGNEHVLYSAMELECKRFNIQGKARDLDVVA